MYSDYGANTLLATSKVTSSAVWIIISAVLAIVGGIVLYFTFLSKKNERKFTGFLGWVYDFLTFKKMIIENILRILYLVAALFITLSSFALISTSFLSFLLTLVIGNVLARVGYELLLITLVICKNTTEINKKLDKKENEFLRNIKECIYTKSLINLFSFITKNISFRDVFCCTFYSFSFLSNFL